MGYFTLLTITVTKSRTGGRKWTVECPEVNIVDFKKYI